MIGIYCIRNLKNDKRYIGQSKNISIRFSQHFSDLRAGRHGNEVLQRAWNKYGENSFVKEVLHECLLEDMDFWEKKYILEFQSDRHAKGYNIEMGGVGVRPMPDSTRRKISLAHKGKKMSEEFRKNQSIRMKGKYIGDKNPMWGKTITPEHQAKMKAGRLAKGVTAEQRERQRVAATNISDETRKKRSISLSGERNPMYGRRGVLAPFFGHKHTEETKRKTSERFKGKKMPKGVIEKNRKFRQGKPKPKKTSKYVGVSKNKHDRWAAYITYMSKSRNLGSFEFEVDAAIAYNNAALEIYGPDAHINEI